MKNFLGAKFILLLSFIFLCSVIIISKGSVDNTFKQLYEVIIHPDNSVLSNVFWELRLPRLLTALLAGAAMSCAGLLIQTYFENPLADPYVLGVHSGSSLAVSLLMVGGISSSLGLGYSLGIVGASALGAMGTLLLLLTLFRIFPSKVMILVLGLILGYFFGGIVSILWAYADANELKNYFLWGLGSFSRTSGMDLKIFSIIVSVGVFCSFMMSKSLNLLLLGEEYACSLGMQGKKVQTFIILLAALLSGSVTAFCGPIAFIGIISPHGARFLFKKNDHRIFIPATILCGIAVALFAEMISSFSVAVILPINAILSLMGFPWIIFLLLNLKKGGSSET